MPRTIRSRISDDIDFPMGHLLPQENHCSIRKGISRFTLPARCSNWQGSLRARVGYAKDEYLIYATGGLAFANYDFDYTCCGLGFGIGDQFDETLLGGTVGGGVARQLHDGWVTWVDYRYTAYEEASSGIVNCCAPAPNSQDHEMDTHAVRVGLSRQLN
jgi:outer membrane immunogenic protein